MTKYLATALSVACLTFMGCGSGGPELGEVSGTVTKNGEPLPDVLVTFVPVDGGRASTGKTDENGEYSLMYGTEPGALVGEHQVKVTSTSSGEAKQAVDPEMSSSSDAYMNQAKGGMSQDAYDSAESTESIPERYNTQTELTFNVTSGSNTYDINIEMQ
jgi:hypothetical protein